MKKLHIEYMTSGPSLILALQRENAVKCLLDLLGPNDPQIARKQSQQLWTAVFGVDPIMNGLFSEELCLTFQRNWAQELRILMDMWLYQVYWEW